MSGAAIPYRVLLLLLLLLTPGPSLAASADKTGMYAELGAKRGTETEPGVITGDIGIEYFDAYGHVSVRGGLSFYAAESKPDVLTGFDLGMRLHAGSRISPFVGVGLFAGSSEQEVPADHDGVDNDGDGAVDEPGETKWEIQDVLAALYPEVGVQLWFTRAIGLALSAKYHMTTEGREFRYWIRSLGFFLQFQ